MCEYLKALQRPFPASDIEWRVDHARQTRNGNQALVLAYVTNRAIMERLDEVFGIAGWKNEFSEWRDKGVLCTISCKVENEWIAKADGADETNIESTKGGFSASMKRAAVQWGIGRYLYNLESTWVPIMDRGQNYINTQVKVGQEKQWVKGYWDTPRLPSWALPEGYDKPPLPQTPEPEGAVDEDLEAIAAASNARYGKPDTGNKHSASQTAEIKPTGALITEGQAKMLFAKYKQSIHKDLPVADVVELISAELAKPIKEFKDIEKADINRVIKWLEEQRAA
jgi:hypothetical protein